MAMTKEERAERDKARKRERYATDPEYRAAKLAANRERAQRSPYNPEYAARYHAKRQATDPEYAARRSAASVRWNKKRIERVNALIARAKDRPCVDCGQQLPSYCMEFDHVRGEKLFGISKAARRSKTIEQIKQEIAKCDVRCVICHRTRHLG